MLRTPIRAGFVAGVLATVALTGCLYLASALFQLSFTPYDLADVIIRATPGAIATQGIETLGTVAKLLVKAAAIASLILIGGGLGAFMAALITWRGKQARSLAQTITLALLLVVLIGAALLNQQASQPSLLMPTRLGVLLIVAVAWVWGLEYLLNRFTPLAGEPAAVEGSELPDRRQFLIRSGATVLTIAVGSTALAELFRSDGNATAAPIADLPQPALRATETPVDLSSFNTPAAVRQRITPQDALYNVSSRTRDPRVDAQTYKLVIDGNVDRPLEWSYEQLLQLPRVDQTSTLQCISNEVGGELIGNCTWNGVRLADLLDQAGVKADTVKVVLHGADGYVDSIALEDALKSTTLIVLGIDNAPLEVKHGYPVRLIVPNIYGMKNVKWLQRIELLPTEFLGYWQERGWSDPAVVKTTSVTDTQGTLAIENGVVPLGGIAVAGSRGIGSVEVQIDDGAWVAAELEPETTPIQWRRWRYDWPATPGNHSISVRATDGTGALQTDQLARPHPDGASGYHFVRVSVRG